jgi:hypothetical protein
MVVVVAVVVVAVLVIMVVHMDHVAGRLVSMFVFVVVVVAMIVIVPMIMVVTMVRMIVVPMIVVPMVVVPMVVMRVIMVIVAAAARFAMLVIMMVVCVMFMAVGLRRLVGAALRFERGFHHRHGGAEAARHFFQHAVAGDADAVGQQFRCDMAVAEVPGETGKVMGVASDDLRHRLFRRHHGDDPAVIELEPVAVLQMRRLGQVQQEGHVAFPAHGDAAAVAAIMRQHHTVGGARRIPGAGGKDLIGADHG